MFREGEFQIFPIQAERQRLTLTVLDFIFSSLNIDFVNCGYFFFNEASKRLQQNLGFHYYRQHLVSRFGLTIPKIENVLMKDEWMKILR